MSAMSWSAGTVLVKLEEAGSIRGKREMISRGSTRPLMNSSWARRSSILFSEINAARLRTKLTTDSKSSGASLLLTVLVATISDNSKASSTLSLFSKNCKEKQNRYPDPERFLFGSYEIHPKLRTLNFSGKSQKINKV